MEEKKTNIVPVEVQVIQAQADAQYSLTPAGQMVKQFATLQRMGQMYSSSSIVPDTYKSQWTKDSDGKLVNSNPAALGNCAIALDMAQRMNVNPLMIMQNLYIVHGNPSFSSKFLISCINASKRFTPLRYEFKGTEGKDDYGCRCVAYEAGDREHKYPLEGDWITWGMVKAEGWNKKEKSKWGTMPNQMFRYRAAAFWQRVYCPEISMGFISSEEAWDEAEIISEERRMKSGESGKRKSIKAIAAETMGMPEMAAESIPAVTTENKESVDTSTGEVVETAQPKSII